MAPLWNFSLRELGVDLAKAYILNKVIKEVGLRFALIVLNCTDFCLSSIAGLLSIITDLYFTSRVPDILFCPISISYDRVLEETLMARELLGVPKPKESLKVVLASQTIIISFLPIS